MVVEIVVAVGLIIFSLYVSLSRGIKADGAIFGYVLFLILLSLVLIGPEKGILFAAGLLPLLYVLKLDQPKNLKASKINSSKFEKLLLYIGISPFFGFIFLVDSTSFIQKVLHNTPTLKDMNYIPEIFLIVATVVCLIEIVKKGDIK